MFPGVPWVRWAQGKGLGQGSGVGLVSPTPLNLWHITLSQTRRMGKALEWSAQMARICCCASGVIHTRAMCYGEQHDNPRRPDYRRWDGRDAKR